MKTVFIFHGSYGSPEENWIPWLKKELERIGVKVYVPKFPTPKNQSFTNWLKVFEKYEKYLDCNSIVVGHSLGVAFLFSILEKIKTPICSAFLVSGFVDLLGYRILIKLIELLFAENLIGKKSVKIAKSL